MSLNAKKEQFIKELQKKLSQKAIGSVIEEIVLLRAFKYFDLKDTGFCSKDIFIRAMLKIGITGLSEDEIAELFPLFNPNEQGLLDYKDFVSNLYSNKSLSSKKENLSPDEKKIQDSSPIKQFAPQDPFEEILNIIREILSSRGITGVCEIARNFRIIDENNTQTIDFTEFKKCCRDYQLGLNDNQIKLLFETLDKDNTGEIDYDEFLRTIRGEMNDFRKSLVNQAFKKLDVNGTGEITFDEMEAKYNAKDHPEVMNGKKTEEEIFKEFIDTFQDTYNYLCGTETDNIITIEEFMEYYENVSMTIEDDEYFEILLNNVWNLDKIIKLKNIRKEKINEVEKKEVEKIEDENFEIIMDKFKKEILSRGNGGIISLNKQFKLIDGNNNKYLELPEFINALNEYKIGLTEEEIIQIFNKFDTNGNGIIEYDEFIKLLRGPMNQKRRDIVTQAFNKLDIDKSGYIELSEIKYAYNAKNNPDVRQGRKTEEEVYSEFMETFQDNHLIKAGPRTKRVTYEEFLDYYNNISMNIKDDDQFVFLIQNAWKLSSNTYSYPGQQIKKSLNMTTKSPESEKEKSINSYKNRDFYSSQISFGNNEPEKKQKNIKEINNIIVPNKSIPVVEKLKNIISKRGTRGIMSMRREFMIEDNENTKKINTNIFKKFCQNYKIPLTDKEISIIFNEFDKNNLGKIDYEEFVKNLIGQMNDRRRKIVTQVFKLFDRNQTGYVELDDIRDNFNPKLHPSVLAGKKNEEEILAEFLDDFEYQFSLLKEEKNKDGKITLDEFLDFYNNISFSIKDDDYFEEIIIGVYNLDKKKNKKV